MSNIEEMSTFILAPRKLESGNVCIPGRNALREGRLDIIQLPSLADIQKIMDIIRQQITDVQNGTHQGFVLLTDEHTPPDDEDSALLVLGETLKAILDNCFPENSTIEPPFTVDSLHTSIVLPISNDTLFLTSVSPHYRELKHPRKYPHAGIVGVSGNAVNSIPREAKQTRKDAYDRAGYEYPPTDFFLP